ncbi:MAG: response regulator, partial [Verrucomicrobiota bacterium]
VEDEHAFSLALGVAVREAGGTPVMAASLAVARQKLAQSIPDGILLDIGLPDGSGLDLLSDLPADQRPPTAIITAHGQIETVIAARELGVHEFIEKPIDFGDLESLLERFRSSSGNEPPTDSASIPPTALIGEAPAMRAVFKRIANACVSPSPTLISGQPGTGLTHVAELIAKQYSQAVQTSVIRIQAPDIESGLLESSEDHAVLIIEQPGAFSSEDQQAIFQLIKRRPNWKFIATDCSSDKSAMENALYFALRVIHISLPPLADRREDIAALSLNFLSRHSTTNQIEPSAIAKLEAAPWPNNLHELESSIRYAANLAAGRKSIKISDLPSSLDDPPTEAPKLVSLDLDQAIDSWLDECELTDYKSLQSELEGILIQQLLARFDGKLAPMAEALNANRSTLRKKLKHIQKEQE